MSTSELPSRPESSTRTLDELTENRRIILDTLDEQSLPITEWHLAALLTADGWGDRSTTQARTKLRHVDLPKLADAGYLTWDESAAAVTEVDLSTLESMETDSNTADATTELDDDRRVAMHLVETLHGPQDERDLAYGVAAISGSGDPDPDAVDEMATRLHHCALPKLDQAELVDYDPEEGLVAAADSSE